VFSVSLYVLVNECLTQEINFQRVIKQGDPLTPFLFLLEMEGLNAEIRCAEGLNHYSGIKIGDFGLAVSLSQYVNDTTSLGKIRWRTFGLLRRFSGALS